MKKRILLLVSVLLLVAVFCGIMVACDSEDSITLDKTKVKEILEKAGYEVELVTIADLDEEDKGYAPAGALSYLYGYKIEDEDEPGDFFYIISFKDEASATAYFKSDDMKAHENEIKKEQNGFEHGQKGKDLYFGTSAPVALLK